MKLNNKYTKYLTDFSQKAGLLISSLLMYSTSQINKTQMKQVVENKNSVYFLEITIIHTNPKY